MKQEFFMSLNGATWQMIASLLFLVVYLCNVYVALRSPKEKMEARRRMALHD